TPFPKTRSSANRVAFLLKSEIGFDASPIVGVTTKPGGGIMGAVATQIKRMRMVIFLGVVTVLSIGASATAETQAKNLSGKKIAKIKTPQATKSSLQKKASQAEPLIISEESALAAFDTFTIEWMKKLGETEDFHKTRAQAVESPDGFTAEY